MLICVRDANKASHTVHLNSLAEIKSVKVNIFRSNTN